MRRGSLLRGIEPVHLGQIGQDILRHRGWHRRVDDFGGLAVATVHRQDHRAQPPGAAILGAQLRGEHLDRTVSLASDPE